MSVRLVARDLQAWTLRQPFATAIAQGAGSPPPNLRWKTVENRDQRRILPPEGRWYGLHAGKEWYWEDYSSLAGEVRCWRSESRWVDDLPLAQLPRSAMLGAFHVARCERYPALAGDPDPHELRDNPWAFGKWCYIVDRVVLLPEPMPCAGMNGSWPVERRAGIPIADALIKAIEAATP